MNISTMLGFALANVFFFLTVFFSLGDFATLYDRNSVMIVFGGSFAATAICVRPRDFKIALVAALRVGTKTKKRDPIGLVTEIVSLSKAYRKGMDAYTAAVKEIQNPFLADTASMLQWIKADVSADNLRELLEARAEGYREELLQPSRVFKLMSKFPPAFGMMGTVLGLIGMLKGLGDPSAKSKIGPSLAVALMTTLYGISLNFLCFVPAGEMLIRDSDKDVQLFEMAIEGLMLIQAGQPTKYIEEKLMSYIDPMLRLQHQAKAG